MWILVVAALFDKQKLKFLLMLKVVVINDDDVKMIHKGWAGIFAVKG